MMSMLLITLAIVIALVSWSLRLMQQAIDRKEFSLMLAGTLVAFSAAAMISVYFLMGNYVGYLAAAAHSKTATAFPTPSYVWVEAQLDPAIDLPVIESRFPAAQ